MHPEEGKLTKVAPPLIKGMLFWLGEKETKGHYVAACPAVVRHRLHVPWAVVPKTHEVSWL